MRGSIVENVVGMVSTTNVSVCLRISDKNSKDMKLCKLRLFETVEK